jgi:hypothetical protein
MRGALSTARRSVKLEPAEKLSQVHHTGATWNSGDLIASLVGHDDRVPLPLSFRGELTCHPRPVGNCFFSAGKRDSLIIRLLIGSASSVREVTSTRHIVECSARGQSREKRNAACGDLTSETTTRATECVMRRVAQKKYAQSCEEASRVDGALLLEHSTHELNCVLRAKLFHDVYTVKFDRTRTDTEQAPGFLTRRSPDYLSECHALPRRQ